MKKIKETIHSNLGFYIGGAGYLANAATANQVIRFALCEGGGKYRDESTGLDLIVFRVPVQYKFVIDNNGDQYSVSTGTLLLCPLELVRNLPISTIKSGRVIFKRGDAQLEAGDNLVKITLPSTEVVEIHMGRTE